VDPNLATDTDLIHRARRGDESAFSILYQQYRRSVFQFAWRLTG